MKNKFITSYIVFLVLAIIFSACGKKPAIQTIKNNKDTVKTIQKPAFDVKSVSAETLPQSIKDYIASNYKEYKITEAAYDPLCKGGDAIDVSVEKAGSESLSLIFTPDGTYIQKEEDAPFTTAPEKVKEVIKLKYSNYLISDEIEKLTLADNTTQYLIDIEKDTLSKEVIFTPDGQVVCEN
ncbi:MAG: PepSY-like domain-containing protein [Ignavibacteriae bacterium]|nr:PepSY-like domain-containing protein [Ignavibacteriota bacterium]